MAGRISQIRLVIRHRQTDRQTDRPTDRRRNRLKRQTETTKLAANQDKEQSQGRKDLLASSRRQTWMQTSFFQKRPCSNGQKKSCCPIFPTPYALKITETTWHFCCAGTPMKQVPRYQDAKIYQVLNCQDTKVDLYQCTRQSTTIRNYQASPTHANRREAFYRLGLFWKPSSGGRRLGEHLLMMMDSCVASITFIYCSVPWQNSLHAKQRAWERRSRQLKQIHIFTLENRGHVRGYTRYVTVS